MKYVGGCKVLHYKLVELNATWLQNPKAHKYTIASQKKCIFSIWVSVYDDSCKIEFLFHLIGQRMKP